MILFMFSFFVCGIISIDFEFITGNTTENSYKNMKTLRRPKIYENSEMPKNDNLTITLNHNSNESISSQKAIIKEKNISKSEFVSDSEIILGNEISGTNIENNTNTISETRNNEKQLQEGLKELDGNQSNGKVIELDDNTKETPIPRVFRHVSLLTATTVPTKKPFPTPSHSVSPKGRNQNPKIASNSVHLHSSKKNISKESSHHIKSTETFSLTANENDFAFNGRVHNRGFIAPYPTKSPTPKPTSTPTPSPSPTASPYIEIKDDDDPDDAENPDNQEMQSVNAFPSAHEKKKEVKGVIRFRPTPSKEPMIMLDDFLAQATTTIYLCLIGFIFGALYAWYMFILSPNNEQRPIPAIFRGNGVDVEEAKPRNPDLDRPRAF